MDLVVDANILFSALIKEGKTKELFVHENFHTFAPEFLLEEFSTYREIILEKTKRTEREFAEIFTILKSLITIVPEEEFYEFLEQAKNISPDKNDVEYFALALKLNCPLWSNDKKLKEQKVVPVYSTEDLARLFSH